MKPTSILISFMILFPIISSAQVLTGFGIKSGITFSHADFKLSDGSSLNNKTFTGFNASLYGELLSNNYFSLVPEIGFDRRAYTWIVIRTDEFGNYLGEANLKYATNYLTANIAGKFKIETEKITSYFTAGTRLDYYIGYNYYFPSDFEAGFGSDYKEPILEDYKKLNFGASIGTGIQFNKLLPYKVFIEFNYLPPLFTSFDNGNLKVTESSYNIKVGVNLKKNKK